MNPFVIGLFLMNLGACAVFALKQNWPWAVIYAGVAMIQMGCLWLTR